MGMKTYNTPRQSAVSDQLDLASFAPMATKRDDVSHARQDLTQFERLAQDMTTIRLTCRPGDGDGSPACRCHAGLSLVAQP